MTQLAFCFDSSACSGCKACQAACKDKHQLPVGLLWRRVYEVTGGGWARSGAAWSSDVFAYHLSISCNHCARPICVEVCPTRAMHKRADGLVVVDQDRCLGCQYCSWACPYDAPQYDRAHGHMTKCDFCADNLEAGLPPACVAACPLRVLDFGEEPSFAAHVRPLPAESLTQPALIVKPHQAAQHAGVLGNAEEVEAAPASERSLIAFTILAQMAAGATWFLSLAQPFNLLAPGVLTIIMLMGLLASVLHLGTPRKAWRAIRNVRTSWLSREVLCASMFAASLGGLTLAARAPGDARAGAWLASLCGLALLISMVQVYRLRTVPEWNRWATTAAFFSTTLLLGSVLCGALIAAGPALALGPIGLIGLRQAIARSEPRTILLLRAATVIALLLTLLSPSGWWEALVLAVIAEALARQHFYATRKPRSVWRFAAPSPLS